MNFDSNGTHIVTQSCYLVDKGKTGASLSKLSLHEQKCYDAFLYVPIAALFYGRNSQAKTHCLLILSDRGGFSNSSTLARVVCCGH